MPPALDFPESITPEARIRMSMFRPQLSLPRGEEIRSGFEGLEIPELPETMFAPRYQLSPTFASRVAPAVESSLAELENMAIEPKTFDRAPAVVRSAEEAELPPRGVGYLEGLGKDDGEDDEEDDDGLWNDEIQRYMKQKINRTIPVVASDQLENLLYQVRPNQKNFAFVMNTAPSTSNGSGEDGNELGHWTSVYVDNEDDFPAIEYYDSLAEGLPPPHVMRGLKRIAKVMNPESMFKLKINNLKLQSDDSPDCGWFCMRFLERRLGGDSFSEASMYDEYMKRIKPEMEKNGENMIEKYKQTFKSYL